MIVKPFDKTHFCAEIGGAVMGAEVPADGAALRSAVLNMATKESAKCTGQPFMKSSALANRAAISALVSPAQKVSQKLL
jgi:hypothetical protein